MLAVGVDLASSTLNEAAKESLMPFIGLNSEAVWFDIKWKHVLLSFNVNTKLHRQSGNYINL